MNMVRQCKSRELFYYKVECYVDMFNYEKLRENFVQGSGMLHILHIIRFKSFIISRREK